MSHAASLESRLTALFSEQLNVEIPSVDTDLIDTSLVDSLMFVEFLARLEEQFDVQVSLEELEIDNFRTISRIAAFLTTKLQSRPLSRPA